MLEDAHELKRRGVDVVIGFVETHGRADTNRLLDGLEIVPRRRIEYRGVTLEEMDVDAVMARSTRRWSIVDELAHTNVPGSKHAEAVRGRLLDSRGRHLGHQRREHPAPRVAQRRDRADDERPRARDAPRLGAPARRRGRQRRRLGRDAARASARGEDLQAGKGRAGAAELLPGRQSVGSARAGAAAARDRAGGSGRSRTGAAKGSSIPSSRKRSWSAWRRTAARSRLLRTGRASPGRLASDWYAVYVETPNEEPGRIQSGGPRRADGEHPACRTARRAGRPAKSAQRSGRPRAVRARARHHARHLRPVGALALADAGQGLRHQSVSRRAAHGDGSHRSARRRRKPGRMPDWSSDRT